MTSEKLIFSDEQKEAIFSDQKRLLVSASAGSGKTKVLVERILDFLSTRKIGLSNMLVVTFTKLASLEMKSRLKTELEKLAESDDYYKQELENLSIANISTLHKFCQNTLREFFYVVQIDPNFQVLEDTTSQYLKNKALDNVIEFYEKSADTDFDNILELFYENRDETVFKHNIISLSDFLKSKPDNFFETTLSDSYNLDFDKNQAVAFIKGEIAELIDYFYHIFAEFVLKAEQLKNQKLLNIVNVDFDNIKLLKSADFQMLHQVSDNIKFAIHRADKTFTSEDLLLLEEVKDAVKTFTKEWEKIQKCINLPSDEILDMDFALNRQMLSKLYEIVKKFDSEYSKLKLEKNVLDFNDLEHYMLKLLKSENIKKQLQTKFLGIFVDEYQDTNEIQEAIISSLSSDNFVFMVGDVKQSIYNFRNCNPQIFINKSVALSLQNQKQLVSLNKNYRSDKNVLNFANLIFDNIMTQKTSELDYQNTSRLIFGESIKPSLEQNINLLLIDTALQDEECLDNASDVYSVKKDKPVLSETKKIDTEALLIANQIADLLNKKIYDNDIKDFRKIDYRDIAILTRTKESIKHISSVLTNCGIPVNSEYRVPIFDQYEVKVLINLLKVMNNSRDDIALASSLKAVCFNLTDNDLAKIKLSNPDKRFFETVKLYTQKDDEISKQINTFFDKIDYLCKKLYSLTISEVVLLAIKIFDLNKKFSAFENYIEMCQNIDYFINTISQIESHNLSALINYLDEFSAKQNADISLKDSLNSVFIGTIHSSKGLEYPVVFLADSNKQFSNMSLKEKLIKNNQLGISISTYNIASKTQRESVIKNIFKIKTSVMEKQEEMRLLYVALTRAKNMLFIVGSCELEKVKAISSAFQIKNAKSYLAWILGSLDKNAITHINNKQSVNIKNNDTNYQISVYSPSQIVFDINSTQQSQPSKDFEKKLSKYFDIKFDKNPYAFKNTVTALLTTENEQADYNITDLKIKPNLEQNQDDDFLAIGTNYHKVMENVDFFDSTNSDLLIDKLVKTNVLTQQDAQMVNASKIDNCKKQICLLIESNDIVFKEKEFIFYPKLSNILQTDYDNRVLVQGKVDLIIIKPEGIILVDYKTSRISNEERLKDEYKLQLDLYAKAVESFYGKKVIKKIIYSFYLDKLIIV